MTGWKLVLFSSEWQCQMLSVLAILHTYSTDDLKMLPSGDLTQIAYKGVNPSGQKQRVHLACVLYRDAAHSWWPFQFCQFAHSQKPFQCKHQRIPCLCILLHMHFDVLWCRAQLCYWSFSQKECPLCNSSSGIFTSIRFHPSRPAWFVHCSTLSICSVLATSNSLVTHLFFLVSSRCKS